MSEASNHRVDKSTWPSGAWQHEPDRVDFEHAGYACLLLRRDRLGHGCGYVAVDSQHPLYGKSYDDAPDELRVHGGLTYANKCHGEICHVPKPGMPDDVWWFGFDAAHAGDLAPGMLRHELAIPALAQFAENSLLRDTYRTEAYMRRETERLARQLREMMTA